MHLSQAAAASLLAACLSTPAVAGVAVDVEIRDRKSGAVLPLYWHDGQRYVQGEPGREYEIALRNRDGCRILAVTSVDGINVITGRTASPAQSGYVVDAWGSVAIDGWRKSMDEVAAFYFTALPDSYAARTGRPDNVGVIGVALFREFPRSTPVAAEDLAREETAPSAGASPETPDAAVTQRRHDGRESRKLGTGHGRRLDSGAAYTDFLRASEEPDEVIRIYYDSRRNLLARGIIPRPYDRYAVRQPDPFPSAFVPDP
jgi:hypothetical protein